MALYSLLSFAGALNGFPPLRSVLFNDALKGDHSGQTSDPAADVAVLATDGAADEIEVKEMLCAWASAQHVTAREDDGMLEELQADGAHEVVVDLHRKLRRPAGRLQMKE